MAPGFEVFGYHNQIQILIFIIPGLLLSVEGRLQRS